MHVWCFWYGMAGERAIELGTKDGCISLGVWSCGNDGPGKWPLTRLNASFCVCGGKTQNYVRFGPANKTRTFTWCLHDVSLTGSSAIYIINRCFVKNDLDVFGRDSRGVFLNNWTSINVVGFSASLYSYHHWHIRRIKHLTCSLTFFTLIWCLRICIQALLMGPWISSRCFFTK